MGYLADQFSGKIADTIVDNRIPDLSVKCNNKINDILK